MVISIEVLEDKEIEVQKEELYKFTFPNSISKVVLMQTLSPGKYKLREDGIVVPEHSRTTTSWKLKFNCL